MRATTTMLPPAGCHACREIAADKLAIVGEKPYVSLVSALV